MNTQHTQKHVKKRIWIADDDSSIRFVLEKALSRAGYGVTLFTHVQEVLTHLSQLAQQPRQPNEASNAIGTLPDALLCDIRMPGGSGLQLLEHMQQHHPNVPVIIMTAFSDMQNAVSALSKGAFEYLAKPFDLNAVTALVQRATTSNTAAQAVAEAEQAMADSLPLAQQQQPTANGIMLGTSPAMQTVYRMIGRLSTTTTTVLIRGETGTGKELAARALHRHSPHASGPFVAINTAAIPADLLESELFGHEKGAFTGAHATRTGRFEQARGGTLFLDEIGDMPADLQTRLLRVLSEGAFYRVGGMKSLPVQTRIVAATHQDLEEKVRNGSFRQDLLHRLHVVAIELPTLRQRSADIPLLLQHFMQRAAQKTSTSFKTFTPQAVRHLQAYSFPGNVRELENLCHSLTVMVPGRNITPDDLPANMRCATDTSIGGDSHPPQSTTAANQHTAATVDGSNWQEQLHSSALTAIQRNDSDIWQHFIAEAEKQLLRAALSHSHNRKAHAAKLLGIGRNTLTRKIQEQFKDDHIT